MPRQFVACKFRPDDKRAYTYHWDGGIALAKGQEVKVPDKSGDGWQRVIVDELVDEPRFPTKPILGIAPPKEPVPGASEQ